MYGCMKAAQLWWEDLSKHLVNNMGFTLNPYDNCVANKMVDGNQCTIIWHVDDLKISHKNRTVVENMIKQIEKKYGTMSTNISNKLTYVGMDFEYKGKEVIISMVSHIEDAINEFPEELSQKVITPAGLHLFEVNKNSEKLDFKEAKIFHRIVAMLLFVCKRARPDVHVPVAFLTTRTTKSDVDDWKKLQRLLGYLKNTLHLKLHLSGQNGMPVIKWWVDAAYATNPDMKSQTGCVMTLGNGAIISKSSKQKINAKSSTEAELIAASDMSGQMLWTLYFLTAQGYNVKDNILYQDNKSAILLEKNAAMSSSQRTKHIKVRYFFMKDKVENGELQIIYCPTENMLGDFFTKPLQGKQFKEFRKLILGLPNDPIEEGVGIDGHKSQMGNGTHLAKDSEF